ncbi:MAG: S-methyl-5-thioribose-1-phosphate isomerase [Chloroflexi bacterium]|nr:S-methyl-5-thioribose-1-phosphate isomerase [Chloroflexota bacterium]MBM3173390.1 S-methyl-5-thioribose-1-phosphate isomerase [Chloroflexota bacterium]MBM3175857.1 S-methyl-5-thioribose-1-phosphate isomerase [Chloroflexota bacterium]MBM4450865.1 S-methyl-5-thioribose-1-phosphate isomerase [Chloroflexota bacterium]
MKPIEWLRDKLRILDQTRLPQETVFVELSDYQQVVAAIKELKVRGAPAIGVAAGYGIALGAGQIKAEGTEAFRQQLDGILRDFADARPTAVNLFRTIERMKKTAAAAHGIQDIKQALVSEALRIHAEEEAATERLSQIGAGLIKDGYTILTHCNTGPLATAGYGTALGIIMAAAKQGKKTQVIATETRPLLQGARLTTWELMQENIPVTLITDSMAGHFMKSGKVDCVIVGADRIAANGDTANKIGTYMLAVLARENKVPFYVAAPTSTIDLSLASGDQIPIEQRSPGEVTTIGGVSLAPAGVKAANPAFDVTPHKYITAIVTEKGIIEKPFVDNLKRLA